MGGFMSVRSCRIIGSVLLVWLCVGCNSSDPIEPGYKPNMDRGRLPGSGLNQDAVQAGSSTEAGATVQAPSATKAVAASNSQIDVSWKDNSTNETGFEVNRSAAGVNGAFVLRASTAAGIIIYRDL